MGHWPSRFILISLDTTPFRAVDGDPVTIVPLTRSEGLRNTL